MIGEAWFYGAILALIGLQLLTLVITYWRGTGPFQNAATAAARANADGAVRCPDCGAENAVGYRFCRRCVTELPGPVETGQAPARPVGRGSR